MFSNIINNYIKENVFKANINFKNFQKLPYTVLKSIDNADYIQVVNETENEIILKYIGSKHTIFTQYNRAKKMYLNISLFAN